MWFWSSREWQRWYSNEKEQDTCKQDLVADKLPQNLLEDLTKFTEKVY